MSYPVIDLVATGSNIRERIRIGGYTVASVSEYLGINETSVYKALRGDTLLSTDNLYALSLLLGLTVNDLIRTAAA